MTLAACAVGSDLEDGRRPSRDAGADASEVEVDAGEGAGGSGGSGGSDGQRGDGAGGSGGEPGGGGGAGGGSTCTPPAASGQCDPFAPCGCKADENCFFTGATDGETRCVPAGGTAAFEACTKVEQCQRGHGCVSGVCKPFCQHDGDCVASAGGSCDQLFVDEGGSQKAISHAKACSARCDLRNPQAVCGAASGVSCLPMDDGSTDCIGGFGSGVGMGACAGNDWKKCAPGHICIDGRDCLKWCRVKVSGDCSGGQRCWGLGDPIVLEGIEYGVCDF